MAWRIELTDEAVKQLKKIGHADAKRIRDYLRGRLQPLEDPRQLGKPLTGQLSGPLSTAETTGGALGVP